MGTATVLLDLIPAKVETPQGIFRNARVVVDGDRVRVFTTRRHASRREVELALEATGVTDVKRPQFRRQPHEIVFADGSVWSAVQSGGCGCGSPLKKFDPKAWQ